jgi:hypothetical protein
MKDINPYIIFNRSLRDILNSFGNGRNINFDDIIKNACCLPLPLNDNEYSNLINSGIAFSLSDLASTLSNPYFFKDTKLIKNIVSKKSLNQYLTNIWDIWKKLFLKSSWTHYSSFLINNEEFKKKLSLINYRYNKLFNKCNDCEKTSLRLPSENRISPSMQFNKIGEAVNLARSTLTGCEGFLYSSETLGNEYVFEDVYSHWKTPNIERMQLFWMPFICCAGELKRKDILLDIFQQIKFRYREIEFTNALVFLYSAHKVNADEILNYFEELNSPSQWNLLTPHNPLLDSLISSFSDKRHFSEILKRELRSMEGTFWSEYFKNYFDNKIQENEALHYKHKHALQFSKKSIEELFMSLIFAQEIYVRELRSRIYNEFLTHFFHYDYLNEKNFFEEIVSGRISQQIKQYQEKISTLVLSKPVNYLKCDVPEIKFIPFIDFILGVHLNFLKSRDSYYEWKNNNENRSSILSKAEIIFKNSNSEITTNEGWQNFLLLLANRIQNNVTVNLSEIFVAEFHSIKRIFIEKFENVSQKKDDQLTDRHEFLSDARKYIKNISHKLPKYKIQEPQPIDIKPEILKYLLTESLRSKTNLCSCSSGIYIAGYDGICDDYLRPMFTEIQSNAKRVFAGIKKPSHRYYEINLHRGENGFSNYLILTVSNNFIKNTKDSLSDPASTRIGLKNIQYYATFFQKDEQQGWAEFKTTYKKKYGRFTVKIYFPIITNF